MSGFNPEGIVKGSGTWAPGTTVREIEGHFHKENEPSDRTPISGDGGVPNVDFKDRVKSHLPGHHGATETSGTGSSGLTGSHGSSGLTGSQGSSGLTGSRGTDLSGRDGDSTSLGSGQAVPRHESAVGAGSGAGYDTSLGERSTGTTGAGLGSEAGIASGLSGSTGSANTATTGATHGISETAERDLQNAQGSTGTGSTGRSGGIASELRNSTSGSGSRVSEEPRVEDRTSGNSGSAAGVGSVGATGASTTGSSHTGTGATGHHGNTTDASNAGQKKEGFLAKLKHALD